MLYGCLIGLVFRSAIVLALPKSTKYVMNRNFLSSPSSVVSTCIVVNTAYDSLTTRVRTKILRLPDVMHLLYHVLVSPPSVYILRKRFVLARSRSSSAIAGSMNDRPLVRMYAPAGSNTLHPSTFGVRLMCLYTFLTSGLEALSADAVCAWLEALSADAACAWLEALSADAACAWLEALPADAACADETTFVVLVVIDAIIVDDGIANKNNPAAGIKKIMFKSQFLWKITVFCQISLQGRNAHQTYPYQNHHQSNLQKNACVDPNCLESSSLL